MSTEFPWLVLVPTAFELQRLDWTPSPGVRVEICGVGPIVASAIGASLIRQLRPARVMLVGIAGTYTSDAAIGCGYVFRHVTCHGVGVGQAEAFVSARELGWAGWNPQLKLSDDLDLDQSIAPADWRRGRLITVCAASANRREANQIQARYHDAVAEDMEGYGVALAAALSHCPLTIVRGISNWAGERDNATWQIDQALRAAKELALPIIGSTTPL